MIGTAAALVAGLAACGSSNNNSSSSSGSTTAPPANTTVGILLPDTATSPRWVSADPNELRKQCTMYKLNCSINNANGSATTMQSQAQALINSGVGVLLVVNLDPGSGKAIESLAKQHNVVAMDYDRLTSGGSAEYYESFDNVKVGVDQGTALTQCLQVKGKGSVNRRRRAGLPRAPFTVIAAKVIGFAAIGALFTYEMGVNRNLTTNAFFSNKAQGMPWVVILLAILFVVWNFILSRTRYGRHMYAIGGNEEASRRAGIAVSRIRISAFVICSGMAAVSGMVAARCSSRCSRTPVPETRCCWPSARP